MRKKMNREKLVSEFYMYAKGCQNGDEVYGELWKLVKESNFGGKEETLYEFTRKYYEMKEWVRETFYKVISRVNSIEGQTASLVVRRANKNEIKAYKKTWLYFKKFEHDFYDVFSISLSDTQYKLQQEEFWSKHSFAQKIDDLGITEADLLGE